MTPGPSRVGRAEGNGGGTSKVGVAMRGRRFRRQWGLTAAALAGAVAVGLLAPQVSALAATAPSPGQPASAASSGPTTAPLPAPPPGTTTVSDGTDGKVAGMAIPNVDPSQSAEEVQRLKADGINTISLFVWWWMPQQSSNFVERCSNPAQQQNCTPTEPDAELQVQIAAAQQYGMRTILVPIFYCGSCEGGWRGTAQPSDTNAWFSSYRQFIDHYADLAQQNRVSTLFIGSEMTSLENQQQQWLNVISEARQHFSGQLGYEENWDVLGNAHYLNSVDVIGVSAYFPLDDAQSPSLGTILGDWRSSQASGYAGHNWVGLVQHLANSTGKPILFGEVGYMSGDYAAKQPFLNFQGTVNWQLQSDLYQAVLATFHSQPWWAGAVWWEWYIPASTGGDNTRTPRAKTAESLLEAWYGRGWRPAQSSTPLVLSAQADSPDNPELAPPPPPPGSGSSAPGGPAGHQSSAGVSGRSATGSAASHGPTSAAAAGTAGAPGRVSTQGTGASASAGPGAASSPTSRKGLPVTILALASLAAAGLAALMALASYGSRSRRAAKRSAPAG